MSEMSTETPAVPGAQSLRSDLEGLVNRWAVGGNGIDAASMDLISACSAELLRVLDQHPGDDAPGSEPQPAKVIIVTDELNREHRYTAPDFGMLHDGTLIIGTRTADGIDGVTGAGIDKLTVAGAHAHARWSRVHKDGALTDGPHPYFHQGKKLTIALDALRKLGSGDYNPDKPGESTFEIAGDALAAIAELDL